MSYWRWRKYFRKQPATEAERVYWYSNSDYEKTFDTAKMILRWSGIKMTHCISESTSALWTAYYWFQFCNVLMALCSEFVSMGETAYGGSFQDAIKIIRMLPCTGFTVLALIKSFKMMRHRAVYENLINELGEMWPTGRIRQAEHRVISSAIRQINFVVKAYFWCNHYLVVSFLYPPLWEMLKRLAGRDWEMILHFFYWLPFNPFQPVYYETMLIVQTWHAVIVIWLNMSGDLLFCLFLSHITTQFELLSFRIKDMVYVPRDAQLISDYPLGEQIPEHAREQERHCADIADIVHRHHALIRLSGDVEDMFSFSLLVNFLNSSTVLCFCGFCSVVVEKWNETAYKSFLVTALSQTWFLCWYGQKLLDSSEGVAEALYCSGWYNASRRVRSSVLIMLHRSQRGISVTTFGFSVVSLASYSTIIKTAWSYFTLLLNAYNK